MITDVMQEIPIYPPGTVVKAKLDESITTPGMFAIGYRNPISPWLDPTLAVEMAFLNDFKGVVLEVVEVGNRLVEGISESYKGLSRLTSYKVVVGGRELWFRWTEVEGIQA